MQGFLFSRESTSGFHDTTYPAYTTRLWQPGQYNPRQLQPRPLKPPDITSHQVFERALRELLPLLLKQQQ